MSGPTFVTLHTGRGDLQITTLNAAVLSDEGAAEFKSDGTYFLVEPDAFAVVTLEIDNAYELYEDVHTSFPGIVIPTPPDEDDDSFDDWKQAFVIAYTGVGHEDGDSWYDVLITESTDPPLVGRKFDWGY